MGGADDDPREDALAWAAHLRDTRSRTCAELETGSTGLAEVLGRRDDPASGAIHLLSVLESLPGARKVITRRTLAEMGVPERIPLADLTGAQVDAVLERFGSRGGGIAGVNATDPLVIVVSGPGGVGKGTVVAELLRRDPALFLNRSWTTRPRRDGEAPDAYHFAGREEFERHVAGGGFLEWVEFLDYLQGSPVPRPAEGQDVVFEIDVAGAARIKELYPGALLVFIDAPDRTEQAARMASRGDDPERIAQRLERAVQEVDRAAALPYVYVVNDDLAATVDEVAGLVEAARKG